MSREYGPTLLDRLEQSSKARIANVKRARESISGNNPPEKVSRPKVRGENLLRLLSPFRFLASLSLLASVPAQQDEFENPEITQIVDTILLENLCDQIDTLPSQASPNPTTSITWKNVSGISLDRYLKSVSGGLLRIGPLPPWSTIERPSSPNQLHLVINPDTEECVFAAYPGTEPGTVIEVGTPENPWPEQIGDFERDGMVIFNMGTKVGVIDNKEDPINNWQGIVSVRQRYAPNDRFRFYFYDNPEQVPSPPRFAPSPLAPWRSGAILDWQQFVGGIVGDSTRRELTIRTYPEGVWELHLNIPYIQDAYNRNRLNVNLSNTILFFLVQKVNGPRPGPEFTSVLRQFSADPFESGKNHFALIPVFAE